MMEGVFGFGLSTNSILLGIVTILLAIWYLHRPRNLPPGPRGFPILGYMPFMLSNPIQTLSELGDKYGPIFSIYLGSRLVVVLNDYDLVKKLLVQSSDYFKDRPDDYAFNLGRKGTFALDYEKSWSHHRRFAISTLREFGVGKLSLEPKITDEIEHFTNDLEKMQGKASDFKDKLGMSVSNNICSLMFGKRYDYEDGQFLRLKHLLDDVAVHINSLSIWLFFPWLRYIPGISKLMNMDQAMKTFQGARDFVIEIIADHRKNHYQDRKDDYMHAYISEQGKRSDEVFTDEALPEIGVGLLAAGTESTQTWLCWVILFLAKYPDMQEKIQMEMDRVIGKDRCPNYSDRLRTPYTCAFIAEVGRYITVIPLVLPHTQKKVAIIGDYRVPPNTYVIYNIHRIHHDPKLWGDPLVFRPERFLTKDGEMQAPEYFMPFGVGKRACTGESLARVELYLYVATFAQKFTFAPPNGETISNEMELGISLTPKKFKVCAVNRP